MNKDTLVRRLREVPLWKAIAILSAVTAAFGYFDYIIGYEISFSVFYLIPVTLAVFFSGQTLGLVFSVVCALVWLFADVFAGIKYSSIYIAGWNTIVRLLYFSLHTTIISKLVEALNEIRAIALYDPLTKAVNWRYFEDAANRLIRTAARDSGKITLAYVDVDNFKRVNDTWGHDAGDDVLIALVEAVSAVIRPSDILARLGGDEFVVLLVDADLEESRDVVARIHRAVVADKRLQKYGVTVSVGAEVFSRMAADVAPMLKEVDALMYEIKKGSKNDFHVVAQET